MASSNGRGADLSGARFKKAPNLAHSDEEHNDLQEEEEKCNFNPEGERYFQVSEAAKTFLKYRKNPNLMFALWEKAEEASKNPNGILAKSVEKEQEILEQGARDVQAAVAFHHAMLGRREKAMKIEQHGLEVLLGLMAADDSSNFGMFLEETCLN